MKKVINVLLVLITMFFCCLINVNAWDIAFEQEEYMSGGYLYGEQLNPGETFSFLLFLEKGDSETVGQISASVTVSYSTNVFEFDSYSDAYGYFDVEKQSGKVIIKFSSEAINNPSFLTLCFKAKENITSNSSGSINLTYNVKIQCEMYNKSYFFPSHNA